MYKLVGTVLSFAILGSVLLGCSGTSETDGPTKVQLAPGAPKAKENDGKTGAQGLPDAVPPVPGK